MKELVYNYAQNNNLIAGICGPEPIYATKDPSAAPFVTKDKTLRTTPRLVMEDTRSIIVLGMGYNKKDVFASDDKVRGEISVGAVGRDYHKSLREHLENLAALLAQRGNLRCKIFVDTGPLMERELAVRAGLGFFGKNGLIINSQFGSFFFIGLMLTDLSLDYTSYPLTASCRQCGLCIASCPGGALNGGSFDYTRCVSYLTQKKGLLSSEEKKIINNSIYGCDICQRVCPHNTYYIEEITDIDSRFPELKSFASLSPTEFKTRYKDTAMFWRGRQTLVRNALIALENRDNAYFQ